MPRTRICAELGIQHPILSVGFGAAAGPELAAAVSNAGGLGVVGASGMPPDFLRERIARTRELTDRPFGANMILADQGNPEFAELTRERCGVLIEERVLLLVFFEGDPTPYVEPAHTAGLKVAIQVGSPAAAREAATAGVDIVIAQGVEAGGHIAARTSLFVNLPTIVDAVAPLPVLASGGIADGRGLAAAIVLGPRGSRSGRVSLRARRRSSPTSTSGASSRRAPRTRTTARTSSTSSGPASRTVRSRRARTRSGTRRAGRRRASGRTRASQSASIARRTGRARCHATRPTC